MNLFFKRLTGKFHSTERMEQHIMAEEERLARYRQVEKTEELKEYFELKKIIESPEFKQKKYNLTHTDYKKTPVYEKVRRHKELLHDKQLHLYIELEGSQRLKDYLVFRNSENYVKLQNPKEVKNSLELRQMANFEKSKEYAAYLEYRDSRITAEFKALSAELATPEFKQEHAFWSNPNRWKTTDEYQQEVRFKRLSAMSDIVFFLSQDPQEIADKEKWFTVMAEEFSWNRLGESMWRAGFAYDNPKLLSLHSFANEKQANTGGKNVGTTDDKLTLFTKKEKATSPAWDPNKGFINKEFDYTSDIIQTADKFRHQGGLIMAKIRVDGPIHHALWLGSGKKLPILSLFHYNGKQITVGNYSDRGFEGEVVRGINAGKYYIYSLRWTERELIWYVNNIEVFRTSRNVPKEKLFLAISSFIDEKQRPAEGQINVAWIRVFDRKD